MRPATRKSQALLRRKANGQAASGLCAATSAQRAQAIAGAAEPSIMNQTGNRSVRMVRHYRSEGHSVDILIVDLYSGRIKP